MILYIDCIGGIAGDMLMAALIDVGAPVEAINTELAKLGIPNLCITTKRTSRHAIDCCHVSVTWGSGQRETPLPAKRVAKPTSSSLQFGLTNDAQGATEPSETPHAHEHDHAHDHDHADRPEHQAENADDATQKHPHRPYAQIRDLLINAGLSPVATTRAQAVFRKLAEAEGAIHGIAADDVYFHEVGSEDAIADVVGVAVALELLGVAEIVVSPLPIGRGFVRSAHGVLPLPAPATLELLRGIPVQGVDIDRELVTPTGAAIVAALGSQFGRFPDMTTSAVGYGAGTRDLTERPNLVRAVLGVRSPDAAAPIQAWRLDQGSERSGDQLGSAAFEVAAADSATSVGRTASAPRATVVVIETNLDDCSPELIPDASFAATNAGALDVWVTPATMKKGRPGFVLHALARPNCQDAVANAILRETSALGVRISTYDRIELDRSFFSVDIDGHPVNIKVGSRDGAVVNVAPEHDDCAAAAAKLLLPVKEVFARALTSASAHLRNSESPS
jgi:pyridinium-3,5-bisthiocarboxylic acid mononucleotide nickel chelatase